MSSSGMGAMHPREALAARFLRWLLALCVALLRVARPRRPALTAPARSAAWATCHSCRTALDTVWRYEDASYCRVCHEDISADSDSSAFSG